MRARIISLWTLSGVLLFVPTILEAEEGSAAPGEDRPALERPVTQAEFSELAEKVDRLQESVDSLAQAIAALERAGSPARTDLVAVEPAGEAGDSSSSEAPPLRTDHAGPLGQAGVGLPPSQADAGEVTRAEFDALAQLVYEQEGAMGDIARRIAQGGGEKYVVDLRSAMAVPQFREELSDAVHDVIRRSGTLRIENRAGIDHRLLVNGREYRVPALRSIDIEVPAGTLTTELVGYEPAKNWTVAAPDYFQGITITPQATPTVYVEPPVFVGPPVIVY